jgi:hypothetical protein
MGGALRQQPPFDHLARHDRVRKTIARLAWLDMWDGTGEYITEHLAGVENSPPHLMAEVLLQFSGVLHFLSRAVASITLSSSWAATYSPL